MRSLTITPTKDRAADWERSNVHLGILPSMSYGYYCRLCIVLASLFPICFSREEFRCKAVAGCEIARCDPSPLSWAHLDRNEFPINCVSDEWEVLKSEVNRLKDKLKDQTEELNIQNKDIKKLKKQIRELQQYQKEGSDRSKSPILAASFPSTPSPSTNENGWMVFQRRKDGSVSFDRTWSEYLNGFGDEDGEFWAGLDKLYLLTSRSKCELRIELWDWEGNLAYAEYSEFSVGTGDTKYVLKVSGYSGTAGDSLTYKGNMNIVHNGMPFTTKDFDNDQALENCAQSPRGGWWFNSCSSSNLNGVYYRGGKYTGSYGDGIVWFPWKLDWWYSMKFVEMKLRPVQ